MSGLHPRGDGILGFGEKTLVSSASEASQAVWDEVGRQGCFSRPDPLDRRHFARGFAVDGETSRRSLRCPQGFMS